MGGLAIFLGFLLSVLLFLHLNAQMRGMLLGAVIIVVLGIFDDIYSLPAMFKFVVQIIAALVAVLMGNGIETLSNPNVFSADPYWELGLAVPATVMWIVAITNAVNLIDGLDGLACGVSTISSMTMLVIALVAEPRGGHSHGRPGRRLHRLSALQPEPRQDLYGGHRLHLPGLYPGGGVHPGAVQVLCHHLLRRPLPHAGPAHLRHLLRHHPPGWPTGESPMAADRSHIHHRLIDMGFNQKQAVAVLYVISAILGLSAVVLTTTSVPEGHDGPAGPVCRGGRISLARPIPLPIRTTLVPEN